MCAKTQTGSLTFRVASVYGGAVRSSYAPGSAAATPAPGCENDPQLRWSLTRTSATSAANDVPVELVVSEEPPVTNLASLPESVAGYDGTGKAVAEK